MGYRTVVLDPDRWRRPGGRRRAPRRRVRRRGRARRPGHGVRRRHDRVREPAGGGARVPRAAHPVAPVAGRGGDRPGPDREKRFLVELRLPGRARSRSIETSRRRPRRRLSIRRSSRPPGSGYDGKGQRTRRPTARRCAPRGAQLGGVPCVLEQRAGARGRAQRRRRPHAPTADVERFRSPRTRTSTASSTSRSCRRRVAAVADRGDRARDGGRRRARLRRCAGVEMFVVDGDLLRQRDRAAAAQQRPLDARRASTSQFEQQVRAVCGLGLGDPSLTAARSGDGEPARRPVGRRRSPTGSRCSRCPMCALHLYGKSAARPGRKMGHLTTWARNPLEAVTLALRARSLITTS